jgi:hypothetical protein
MQIETKYLRLRTPVTLGSRFDDWSVVWIGGWTNKYKLCFLVLVMRVNPDGPLPKDLGSKSTFEASPRRAVGWRRSDIELARFRVGASKRYPRP